MSVYFAKTQTSLKNCKNLIYRSLGLLILIKTKRENQKLVSSEAIKISIIQNWYMTKFSIRFHKLIAKIVHLHGYFYHRQYENNYFHCAFEQLKTNSMWLKPSYWHICYLKMYSIWRVRSLVLQALTPMTG